MAYCFNLLILVASLAVWQSAADDACDSVECLPAPGAVCALSERTGSVALFADECVLRCTNCRLAADFKKVNDSSCSTGTTVIGVCPDFSPKNGDGIAMVEVDVEPGDDASDGGVPPLFGGSLPLPLPLPLLSMGSELLRRLVEPIQSQTEPPPPQPEQLTLVKADVKMDVSINFFAPPPQPPQPPGSRLSPPPPLVWMPGASLLAPPSPHAEPLQPGYEPETSELDAYSAAPATAPAAAATALASLVALTVAALHI